MQPQPENRSNLKLKIQQKLQQQQSESLNQLPPATTPTSTFIRTATKQTSNTNKSAPAPSIIGHHTNTKRSPTIKVIKCKKPLCHFKFYLDIRDHQLTKRIEEQIKFLGGSLEFFLTPEVTHFVTDKPTTKTTTAATTSGNSNNTTSCPVTPLTPQTPQTPLSFLDSNNAATAAASKKPIGRNSRADAILNRARRQSTAALNFSEQASATTPTTTRKASELAITAAPTYVVWQTEHALKFFKKVQHELKEFLGLDKLTSGKKSSSCSQLIEPITLKGGFIKVEALKRNYRPYYQLLKKPQEWPKIELTREDGAFRLSPKKEILKEQQSTTAAARPLNNNKQEEQSVAAVVKNCNNTMTRKTKSRSSQNPTAALKKVNGDHISTNAAGGEQKNAAANTNTAPAAQCKQQEKDSTDKQCGVCEICKIEYDALTIHLKTKDHEYFARNSQNFIALDTLIQASANVNKFLEHNNQLKIKTEMNEDDDDGEDDDDEEEEMEVDHQELIHQRDPLEDGNTNDEGGAVTVIADDDGTTAAGANHNTKRKILETLVVTTKMVSPTLREKSKRSTKGKHSSEKFQNFLTGGIATGSKSPKSPSPQKSTQNITTPVAAAQQQHQQHYTHRKHASSSAANQISPPIRAMLPPNSLYKVVESHTDASCATPRRKAHQLDSNAADVVASPSLIVKFKKVRNTELEVLNGEADNFMFPKRKPDFSDLPTDTDRHTTSEDRLQATQSSQIRSSSSLVDYNSSVAGSTTVTEDDEDDDEREQEIENRKINTTNSKKAIARAKRKLAKGQVVLQPTTRLLPCTVAKATSVSAAARQSFPKTPIQPANAEKLKRSTTTAAATKRHSTDGAAAAAAVAITTIPEATRKSSRTATAIVTAATTSSRLLQAAVNAARTKNKLEANNKLQPSNQTQMGNLKVRIKKELIDEDEVKQQRDRNRKQKRSGQQSLHNVRSQTSGRFIPLQMLEDGMGEITNKNQKPTTTIKQEITNEFLDFQDSVELELLLDDDTVDNDDARDKDYRIRVKSKNKINAEANDDAIVGATSTRSATRHSISSIVSTTDKKKAVQHNAASTPTRNKRLNKRNSLKVVHAEEEEEEEEAVVAQQEIPKAQASKCPASAQKSAQKPAQKAQKCIKPAATAAAVVAEVKETIENLNTSSRALRLASRRSRLFVTEQEEEEDANEQEEEEAEKEEEKSKKNVTHTKPSTDKQQQQQQQQKTELVVPPAIKTPAKTTKPKKSLTKSPQKQQTAPLSSPVKEPAEVQAEDTPFEACNIRLTSSSIAARYFDYTKSERLQNMIYAFERLPSNDIWWRVYKRQDNSAEKYYEYFASTSYRKLPYEMGPIPFDISLVGSLNRKINCQLCASSQTKQEADSAQKAKVKRELKLDLIVDGVTDAVLKAEKTEQLVENQDTSLVQQQHQLHDNENETEPEHSKTNAATANSKQISSSSSVAMEKEAMTSSAASSQYTVRHKKLHLLQRYRQEQQQQQHQQLELLQRQNLENQVQLSNRIHAETIGDADISLGGTMLRKRAASTHSNASSSNGSITSCLADGSKLKKQLLLRHKHLNKAAFLANFELPPRKSPREHASTLALVSCMIKKRQDSLSKSNSETDEPATTPTASGAIENILNVTSALVNNAEEKQQDESNAMEDEGNNKKMQKKEHKDDVKHVTKTPTKTQTHKESTSTAAQDSVSNSPVNSPRTRSQANTPVEELRFATEISETVKRMRRGQNKYDYSPPFVSRTLKPSAARRQMTSSRGTRRGGSHCSATWDVSRRLAFSTSTAAAETQPAAAVIQNEEQEQEQKQQSTATTACLTTGSTTIRAAGIGAGKLQTSVGPGRRRRGRQKGYNLVRKVDNLVPSIRKTGSKKGVLEFDVDNSALEALQTSAIEQTNYKMLEWQIDKYLELIGKDYDMSLELNDNGNEQQTQQEEESSTNQSSVSCSSTASTPNEAEQTQQSSAAAATSLCTPPNTDYFSSDFDLCDLIKATTQSHNNDAADNMPNTSCPANEKKFSIFNTAHMHKYYRKRKSLKSNRTGWPKLPKRKAATRQQKKIEEKIYFLPNGDCITSTLCDKKSGTAANLIAADVTANGQRQEGVITPPDSDAEARESRTAMKTIKLAVVVDEDANADDDDDDEEYDESQLGINEDSQQTVLDDEDNVDAEDEEDEEADNETINDSIEDEVADDDDNANAENGKVQKLESDVDADVEENDDDDDDDDDVDDNDVKRKLIQNKAENVANGLRCDDDEDSDLYEPEVKRKRCSLRSPMPQKCTEAATAVAGQTSQNPNSSTPCSSTKINNCHNLLTIAGATTTTPFLRTGMRRTTTPILNGIVVGSSCVSPSEKAGDNSDIFTVSSDGLDTDLDLSNSHSAAHMKHLNHDDDNSLHPHTHHSSSSHHHQQQQQHCGSSTAAPKRKFDLSKYAPTNAATCAAEAATAAVKSLAISQFLKKEVRVTCRRLRAPFKRFRYRR